MPSRAGLSGLALAEIAAGVILAWSGIENQTLTSTLNSLIRGKAPAPGPAGDPGTIVAGAAGSPAGGTATVTPGQQNISPAQAYSALRNAGASAAAAVTLTAIGGAESGWNTKAVNNNPATGDYSIGVWQINYYGNLLASRTAQFGPPSALIGNLAAQAAAAVAIWHEQGLAAWTTYTSGAYQAYLTQAMAAAAGP